MKLYRPKPAVRPEVKELLAARSGGRCEAALHGCTLVATDACHRISRKAGGRGPDHDRLSNVWHGCRNCHQWTHANPAAAYDMGLCLKEGMDPELEPVPYRAESWCLLLDSGEVKPL